MKNRIRAVRKDAHLTQSEFGERISVTAAAVGNYETGLRIPSNSVISFICKEFDINEQWLRTGEGDMKKETPRSFVDELASQHHLGRNATALLNVVASAFETLGEDQTADILDRMFVLLQQREASKATISADRLASAVDPQESDDSGVGIG